MLCRFESNEVKKKFDNAWKKLSSIHFDSSNTTISRIRIQNVKIVFFIYMCRPRHCIRMKVYCYFKKKKEKIIERPHPVTVSNFITW